MTILPKIRFVGFETFQQRKLNDLFEQKATVKLVDCEVKKARSGDGYELLLKRYTEIKESPKKLDFESIHKEQSASPNPKSIAEIENLNVFDKVTIHAKVMKVNPSKTVSDLPYQDVVVADSTGTIRVSLWGTSIEKMIEGESYCLKNFTVRLYHSRKYINQAKNQSLIEKIDDIGTVIADKIDEDEEVSMTKQVKIIGVPILDVYKSYLLCKARVEPMTPPMGKCSKTECAMIQRYDMCPDQASANLLLQYQPDDDLTKLIQLSAFNKVLFEITNISPDENLTCGALLTAPTFTSMMYFTDKKIIKCFSK